MSPLLCCRTVLEKLEKGLTVEPETFEETTLGFTAVTEFAQFVLISTPLAVVDFLNQLYNMFDTIIEQFDVYKVRRGYSHFIRKHLCLAACLGVILYFSSFFPGRNYTGILCGEIHLG